MKKKYLITAVLLPIFACGNNDNNKLKTKEKVLVQNVVEEEEGTLELEQEKLILDVEKVEKVVQAKEVEKQVVEENKKKPAAIVEDVDLVEGVDKVIEEKKLELLPNHMDWDVLTKKYVTKDGKVNYSGMKEEISKIKIYLKHLEDTPVEKKWSKNEQLAYWINLYNASTVYLIASNYPVASITKINGGKPWDKKFVKSGTKVYSLNQIENEIVRPQFKDPRIHAALNCAAVSCPKLMNAAFNSSKLDIQLDAQSKAWINDSKKNQLSPTKLKVSKIFEWYGDDFKGIGGIVGFINKYKNNKMLITSKAKISYLEYNWALNE